MKIELKTEHEISRSLHRQITSLRNACFPECRHDRSYFKQLPHFRYLVYEGEELVGHMGVDHRAISVGGTVFRIFGVVDFCVSESCRGKGIASAVLVELEKLAKKSDIDFLFLVADNPGVYRRNGFEYIPAECHWLRIDEHKNYGVGIEKMENEVMIKKIGGKSWGSGAIDLLGYLF